MNKLLATALILVAFLGCAKTYAQDYSDVMNISMEEAKTILMEQEQEISTAEREQEARFIVAFNNNQNDMIKPRASKKHDRVTFIIEDKTETKIEAETNLDSEAKYEFNLETWFTLDRNDNGDLRLKPYSMYTDDGEITGSNQNPQVKFDSTIDHSGSGDTSRKNSFKTELSGEVIDVRPNGHLIVEARKTIQVNGETQTAILVGKVDPNDLDEDSKVEGNKIMDLKISFTGEGEVNDAIRPGILSKIIGKFKLF